MISWPATSFCWLVLHQVFQSYYFHHEFYSFFCSWLFFCLTTDNWDYLCKICFISGIRRNSLHNFQFFITNLISISFPLISFNLRALKSLMKILYLSNQTVSKQVLNCFTFNCLRIIINQEKTRASILWKDFDPNDNEHVFEMAYYKLPSHRKLIGNKIIPEL